VTVVVEVKVKPRSRMSSLTKLLDGKWEACVKAAPVDGKANAELISPMAKEFGCSKRQVSIKSGAGSHLKIVRIEGA
jgi:uncharacterized protein